MAVFRAQIATAQDSLLPADRIMITPHFVSTSGQDYEALVEEIANAWDAYCVTGNEITVKLYAAEDVVPPNFPLAEHTIQTGIASPSTINRDSAMCLSFYAGVNRPRYRGRVYVPCSLTGIAPSGARPSGTNQTKVGALAQVLADIGPPDFQWCVFSRRDMVGRAVTNWWVDNNWDTQRRRGTRPTSRLEGTIAG